MEEYCTIRILLNYFINHAKSALKSQWVPMNNFPLFITGKNTIITLSIPNNPNGCFNSKGLNRGNSYPYGVVGYRGCLDAPQTQINMNLKTARHRDAVAAPVTPAGNTTVQIPTTCCRGRRRRRRSWHQSTAKLTKMIKYMKCNVLESAAE